MKQFTVTLVCHITGRESDYFVSFPTEESLGQYFAGMRDRLVAVSDGWGGFFEHFRVMERAIKSKPDWERWWNDSKYKYQEAYDYMQDDLL